MAALACFEPLLTGSVLHGTATPYSDINLYLFADSQKDVELYLLNRDWAYKTGEKRLRFSDGLRPVPVLLLSSNDAADVQLAIFSTKERHQLPLSPIDGCMMQGARSTAAQLLLDNKI